MSDPWLSVTGILLTQRKPRVVGAGRQDKHINAIGIAIRIGVRGVVADSGVGNVIGFACLSMVVQPIVDMEGCLGARAAGPGRLPD